MGDAGVRSPLPGTHPDVGGGYRPDKQARSNQLARIAVKLAEKKINELFEYDEDVKTLAAYMNAAGTTGALEQRFFARMRLFYGWLKVRFGQHQCDVYQNVNSTDPEIQASSNGSG